MLEHVTHEVTISALPTEIPESIPADVSGMEINDTLQLSAIVAPEGVEFVLGEDQSADEITIATLSPPRVEEEPEPEIEEEAELVGEEGEARRGRGGRGRVRRRLVRRLRRLGGVAPCACFARRSEDAAAIASSSSGSATRAAATRAPATTSASRSPSSSLSAGTCRSRSRKYGADLAEGRIRPGGPRVVVLTPQTFMNESGKAAGPARGALRIPLDHVVAIHDEIDLPFGEIRTKLGGGVGRAQRAQEPARRVRIDTTSGGSGSGSGAPTRPTRRSSPPTCSAASASPRPTWRR